CTAQVLYYYGGDYEAAPFDFW
nr:immunoglobulin heavy chain junction region [Macaca mulatta]MOV44918.1 immunoglobulin heavy chain junction region [Macaca mulatta]